MRPARLNAASFAAVSVAMLALIGCERQQLADVRTFQAAETALADGDFGVARENYRHFISTYPQHPLARIARQRIRLLDAERDAITGRTDGAVPNYVNPRSLRAPEPPAPTTAGGGTGGAP